jgi:hypothetical protein
MAAAAALDATTREERAWQAAACRSGSASSSARRAARAWVTPPAASALQQARLACCASAGSLPGWAMPCTTCSACQRTVLAPLRRQPASCGASCCARLCRAARLPAGVQRGGRSEAQLLQLDARADEAARAQAAAQPTTTPRRPLPTTAAHLVHRQERCHLDAVAKAGRLQHLAQRARHARPQHLRRSRGAALRHVAQQQRRVVAHVRGLPALGAASLRRAARPAAEACLGLCQLQGPHPQLAAGQPGGSARAARGGAARPAPPAGQPRRAAGRREGRPSW